MALEKFNQRSLCFIMIITLLTVIYIYFGLDNSSNLRTFIRRSLASKRGRALNTLIINYMHTDSQEKELFIKNVRMIKTLSNLGFHAAIQILEKLQIKFYTFFGKEKNIENNQMIRFFDDLLSGNSEEVNSDLDYVIEKLLKI